MYDRIIHSWRSDGTTGVYLLKQGHPEQIAQNHIPAAFEELRV